ncbi:glycosyltransferase family 4 protein [Opitutales bacterium ASA1]|uniref:glycosyltransferase family 4 protein n=1 Tax=Congregicoccus parvus TaxID=3081749 RepID=UPI002B302537|nr:glycosyltransferase family 4 protein [Opitutales bacterium ASA1]
MKRAVIVWGNWGPYHYARFHAFRRAAAERDLDVRGIELFPKSGIYEWTNARATEGMHYLDFGSREMSFRPWLLTTKLAPLVLRLKPDVAFVPSYWHWSLFLNAVSRLAGARIVMMNESHAGTERATGLKKRIKKCIVSSFHAGLVGGSPHRRYFAGLGLPESRIFLGYDAIDNEHFRRGADAARAAESEERRRLDLPSKYFLSLGRFVEKKNLARLVEAYSGISPAAGGLFHQLVFVGSGELESELRSQCATLGLAVIDHRADESAKPNYSERERGVHFYGFRQVDENPVFYAFASAFVLPSLYEEWGLVVNEAMACGIPVVVSRNVGSAEDLVTHGRNGFLFEPTDVVALRRALQTLVNDPAIVASMGCESLARIGDWGCDQFARGALEASETALRV